MSNEKGHYNGDKSTIPIDRDVSLISKLKETSLSILVVDENEIIVEVNKAFLNYSNFERIQILGKSITVLNLTEYSGGQIFGDAAVEQLSNDQRIVEFVTGKKTKKLAIATEIPSEARGGVLKQILLQDVTPLMQDIEYYEYTNKSAQVGGWEYDVFNKTFRASKEVYNIHEVGLHSFFQISDPFKFYGHSVQDLMNSEFRDCIINQVPKKFDCLPFYSASGKKKWVKLTFTPVVAGKTTIKIFGSLQDITEEIELKNQLEVSQKKYEDLFEYSPNPLIVIRVSDDRIIQVNKAATQFYGYTKEEFLKLTAFDIRPKAYTAEYEAKKKIGDEFQGNTFNYRKVTHLHKSGEKLLIDVFRRDTVIDNDRVIIKMVTDVRAIEEAKNRIERMNQMLGTLIDSSPLAIIAIDENGHVELWNSSAEAMFGWTKDEVLGLEIPYVPVNKRKEYEKNLADGFYIKKSALFELERQKKDGSLISIREYATPLKNVNGRIDRFMLIIEDVTESEKVKQALIESERNYRSLVEASNDLIWKLSVDSRIEFVNHASFEVLGYLPEELIGNYFEQLLCDDEKSHCSLAHNEVMKGSKFDNLELKMLTKEGLIKHLNATVYPVFDSTGQISGCAGSASDITHIIEHQHHLETMLKEKEILIKEIHHRVKNNLAVVSGLLTLQANSQTDESTIVALTESQSRIQSIATIHEKLYQDGLFTQIEMNSYLKKLTSDIADTYSNIHRNISVEVVGEEVFLNVNQAVPFGILTNELVINAFKYAFEGLHDGLIILNFKKSGDEVTFTVSDNGVGLPENFSPQASGSLGMTLVQSLSLQLGAELTYWSDKGANFSIQFTPDK